MLDTTGDRHCSRCPGEGGYMLLSVVGMLGVVTILAVALFGMTLTAVNVSRAFGDKLDASTAAESALDSVVHDLQRTVAAAGQDCFGSGDLGGTHDKSYAETVTFPDGDSIDVIVDCSTNGPPSEARDLSLDAFVSGESSPTARARVLIVDEVGGLSRPGSEVRVCDWQVGRNVRSTSRACS